MERPLVNVLAVHASPRPSAGRGAVVLAALAAVAGLAASLPHALRDQGRDAAPANDRSSVAERVDDAGRQPFASTSSPAPDAAAPAAAVDPVTPVPTPAPAAPATSPAAATPAAPVHASAPPAAVVAPAAAPAVVPEEVPLPPVVEHADNVVVVDLAADDAASSVTSSVGAQEGVDLFRMLVEVDPVSTPLPEILVWVHFENRDTVATAFDAAAVRVSAWQDGAEVTSAAGGAGTVHIEPGETATLHVVLPVPGPGAYELTADLHR